jgi:hypothetical protein
MTATPNKDTTMTTHTPADIELPAHTCRLSGIESDLLRKYAEAFARAAVIADRARTAASCAGWVSVDERVPAKDEPVLVFSPDGAMGVSIDEWCTYHESPVSWSSATFITGEGWANHEFEQVTHWMPLPAAPGAPATVRAERTDAATVADTLERFNAWRCDSDGVIAHPEPRAIGESLDKAVAMLRAPGVAPAEPAPVVQPVAINEGEHRFALRKGQGYAPGGYMFRCLRCNAMSTGDKRASCCEACADAAIDAARGVPAPTAGDAGGATSSEGANAQ